MENSVLIFPLFFLFVGFSFTYWLFFRCNPVTGSLFPLPLLFMSFFHFPAPVKNMLLLFFLVKVRAVLPPRPFFLYSSCTPNHAFTGFVSFQQLIRYFS